MVVDGSDEADEAEEFMEDGPSTSGNEEPGNAAILGDDEFEVEAILARKGGYNGKTLMYKIRWVRFRQAVYNY